MAPWRYEASSTAMLAALHGAQQCICHDRALADSRQLRNARGLASQLRLGLGYVTVDPRQLLPRREFGDRHRMAQA
jgi:hypothetical protein